MKLYLSIPENLPKTALTLGTFDGLHLGHQALFKRMKELSSHTTLVTFINHPLEVLNPQKAPRKILTPFSLKLSLLDSFGIDAVILLPFTKEFAQIPFDTFLSYFNLSHLILGKGSLFGKGREGSEENVLKYAEKSSFSAKYLAKLTFEDEEISSSRIRSSIASGELKKAEKLLGRPHTLFWPSQENSLALPPDGDYPLSTKGGEKALLKVRNQAIQTIDPSPSIPTLFYFET